MEMGLVEGETIKRVGESPFGDPIEFSISGYRLVLRASEASRVEVDES
jgi:Fe2+ transport system protein FeoA